MVDGYNACLKGGSFRVLVGCIVAVVQGRAGATSGANEAEEILVHRGSRGSQENNHRVGSNSTIAGIGFCWCTTPETRDDHPGFRVLRVSPQGWLLHRDGC